MTASGGTSQTRRSLDNLIACVKHDQELLESYHDETRRAVLQQLMTYHRNLLSRTRGSRCAIP